MSLANIGAGPKVIRSLNNIIAIFLALSCYDAFIEIMNDSVIYIYAIYTILSILTI
jgi:hypothetical protein